MIDDLRFWARRDRFWFVMCCVMIPFSLLRLVAAIYFGSPWTDRFALLALWVVVALQSIRITLADAQTRAWRWVAERNVEARRSSS